jgi:DNA-binding response OmpR family regulator
VEEVFDSFSGIVHTIIWFSAWNDSETFIAIKSSITRSERKSEVKSMSRDEKATILIVEDNPLTLQVFIEYLQKLGLNTSVARSGEEALRQVGQVTPNLILLDVMMPGMDGFETCQHLKSRQVTKDIPVVFVTALTDTANKVKAFEVGGVDYITKPFDFKEVLARVNTRLTIQKLQERLKMKSAFPVYGGRGSQEKRKATILVVDDEPAMRHALGNYLTRSGFDTVEIASGEEALDVLKTTTPDLILLDVLMAGMNGFETCRRLKQNRATKDIPVIFMTALSSLEDKVKCFEAGGADYIMKPHHYAEVIARINTHLTLQTLQRLSQKA